MTDERKITCRYLRLNGEQCTGEAIDPDGRVILCAKHAGRVLAMVREAAYDRVKS